MITLALAVLLPGLLGGVVLRGAGVSSRLLWLGYGYVLGMLSITVLIRWADGLGVPLRFPLLAGLVGVLVILGAWWGKSRVSGRFAVTILAGQPLWRKVLFGLLLAWVALRFYDLAFEIVERPLYPWDAWTTWAVRAPVWFAFKSLIPFVDASRWLNADPTHTVYTQDAWRYPPAIGLMQLWMALAYGRWDEAVNNLPWLFCAMTLGLAFYGQARLWTGRPLLSLVFTYLLLSMPLLDTHVALAGYADLWMATTYSLAAIALLQWLRAQETGQGLLALVMGLACCLIKVEGVVWMMTLLPTALFALTARRYRIGLAGAVIVLFVVWRQMGGFAIRLPGLGLLQVRPDLIQAPYLGIFNIAYQPVWEPFIQNLFVLGSWNLFWYLLIALQLVALPKMFRDLRLLAYSGVVASGLTLLFVLFCLTEAREWATKYTSINRLFLHITPLLMFYALILFDALSRTDPDTSAASAPPPD
ncbi:MAG: hypothetical protein H6970_03115 [Gammaproteobacteria bacterium]|nr:hypothetical protein [Gammaproteobacteria bacterium]MCP5424048.1 hypothetical protein [Gammaproteobacteria bacterium]MCP5459518.1 hypothetical protein [Gammaproteobacteria bacterium]